MISVIIQIFAFLFVFPFLVVNILVSSSSPREVVHSSGTERKCHYRNISGATTTTETLFPKDGIGMDKKIWKLECEPVADQ